MAEVDPPPQASPERYLSSWRLAVVIACLFFGAFLIALDTNIVNVAIPKISSEFHSLQDVAWYGTAYLLTITAFQPIYGSLYKYFETDLIYRISILVFEGISFPAPNRKVCSLILSFSGYNPLRRGSLFEYVYRRKSCCWLGCRRCSSRCIEHYQPGRRIGEETAVYGNCD